MSLLLHTGIKNLVILVKRAPGNYVLCHLFHRTASSIWYWVVEKDWVHIHIKTWNDRSHRHALVMHIQPTSHSSKFIYSECLMPLGFVCHIFVADSSPNTKYKTNNYIHSAVSIYHIKDYHWERDFGLWNTWKVVYVPNSCGKEDLDIYIHSLAVCSMWCNYLFTP